MADTTIAGLGTKAAPLDYKIPKSIEVLPRSVKATFDGTGAGASFLPTLQVIADSGDVVGSFPVDTAVAAGASADVSWFPRALKAASSASGAAIIGACAGVRFDIATPAGPADYHVVYDTLVYDTSGGAMWVVGSPTVMTAPSDGLYILVFNISIDVTTNTSVEGKIFSNGPPGTATAELPGANMARNEWQVTTTTKLTAGQTVFSQISYNGAALTVFGRFGVGNYRNWFSMAKLA